jgi:fluoroacetyl-CoA thioesterase
MKPTLKPGLTHALEFTVTDAKTVPALYPEAASFQDMPRVLATGFLVGLMEWACLELMIPHLDWPREQSVGTHVNFSHQSATLPGMTVTVRATLTRLNKRKAEFDVVAHDGVDEISRGTHERFIIDRERFFHGVNKKAALAATSPLSR